jgi:biopolymer transport protein ExbD
MSWKVRHQGSPRTIDDLTLVQIGEGLQEGLWEATDEVIGPSDRQWQAIENHPQLAHAALDLETPPRQEPEDETRLDMNPLIDVALVLLIFFMLVTSYAALQKVLPLPDQTTQDVKGPIKVGQVASLTIKVTARQENGRPVIQVEDKQVEPSGLVSALGQYRREKQRTSLLLDAGEGVTWGTVVMIQDAAKEAGYEHAYQLRRAPAQPGR